MEKIKIFFSKNGIIISIILLLIFLLSTCNKNRKIKRINKQKDFLTVQNDSLIKLIPDKDNIDLIYLKSRFEVYNKLNNEILKRYKDRQSQITELQQLIIVPNMDSLNIKIKRLENDKK